jgi:hypothetical protein
MKVKILSFAAVIILALAFSGWAQVEDTAKVVEKKAPAEEPKPAAEPEKKPTTEAVKKPAAMPALTVETELCSGIEERMPTGMADTFTPDVENVYLWCKVIGCKDSTVIHHVWYYKGEKVADVELPVRSSSWRTWSSKSILPAWVGDWKVTVVDAGGKELAAIPFKIAAAVAPTE